MLGKRANSIRRNSYHTNSGSLCILFGSLGVDMHRASGLLRIRERDSLPEPGMNVPYSSGRWWWRWFQFATDANYKDLCGVRALKAKASTTSEMRARASQSVVLYQFRVLFNWWPPASPAWLLWSIWSYGRWGGGVDQYLFVMIWIRSDRNPVSWLAGPYRVPLDSWSFCCNL